MGLITAKKRNEGWLKKTFILARNIILDTLLRRMMQFAEAFPDEKIVVSLIRQLSWTHIIAVIPINDPLKRAFFGIDVSGSNSIIYWFDLPSNIYTDSDGIVSGQGTQQGTYSLNFAGINSMDGCGNTIWVVGDKYVVKFAEINTSSPSSITYTNTFNYIYNSVFVYDPNNIIAAGSNIMSYSTNGGTNWTDFSLNGIVNSIGIFDTSNAIAVCNSGKIFTSSNWRSGSSSWTQISTEALNVSGNANRLNDASYNLTNVGILNTNNFYL